MADEDAGFIEVSPTMLEGDEHSIEVVSSQGRYSTSSSDGDFLSMNTLSSQDGDAYEKREDITQTKQVLEKLKETLTFKDETILNELTDKLKARVRLDNGIGGEISNLEQIVQNEELADEDLRNSATTAKDLISKARQTANDGKTTLKRALEVSEQTLPIFISACDVSKDKFELSDEYKHALGAHHRSKQEMLQCQKNFDMDGRARYLERSKECLEQSIKAAIEDSKRIKEKKKAEADEGRLKLFKQTKDEVELVISTENQELDASLVACQEDIEKTNNAVAQQIERYDDATKKYEARIKKLEVKIHVNRGRQEDLRRQLQELEGEERRLLNNKEFERKVQDRAGELHHKTLQDLQNLKESIEGIQSRARTALTVMESMYEWSKILFEKSIETEMKQREKLQQLEIEAVTRERNALATAVVECKLQIEMGDDNIREYKEQLRDLTTQIERAASRGQAVVVQKKRQDLEDFKVEVRKETAARNESVANLQDLEQKLKQVDEELRNLGVAIQSVEELYEQRMAEQRMNIDGMSGAFSLG